MINPKRKLAKNITNETYNKTPIENFGEKLFEKMSKNKTTNLSRKRKSPSEIKEIIPRNNKYGLGYHPEEDINKNLKEPISFYGIKIKIIKGKFKNLTGKILNTNKYYSFNDLIKNNENIEIQLDLNAQKLYIENNIIIQITENDVIENDKNIKLEESFNSNSYKEENLEKTKLEWIQEGIIIRIIKEDSKYYNTKAKVENLMDEYSFCLLTNDNTLHMEFTEEDCETVIPKINEDIIILTGEYKGKLAKLIHRDKKNNIVNVQLYEDISQIIKLTQDDICMINK